MAITNDTAWGEIADRATARRNVHNGCKPGGVAHRRAKLAGEGKATSPYLNKPTLSERERALLDAASLAYTHLGTLYGVNASVESVLRKAIQAYHNA